MKEMIYEMSGKEMKEYLEENFYHLDTETKRVIATMLVHLEYHREFLEENNLTDDFIGNYYESRENPFEVH